MKIWNKPQVREQEVGLEVTSYMPAEIDIISRCRFLRYRCGGRAIDHRIFFVAPPMRATRGYLSKLASTCAIHFSNEVRRISTSKLMPSMTPVA